MTRVLVVQPDAPDPQAIRAAADVIRRSGLVAFPTETVYGLGANALDATAVARIFEAKGRPANDPLIVHLASVDDLPRVVQSVPPVARELVRVFWPGPLTLVLPKSDLIPASVTAGLDTVAVRAPSHPVAQALLRASRVPIAAPSANRFGHVSPTTAQHVLADLRGRIDVVLDGGPTPVGVESTVLDVTRTPPAILRPGGVWREELEMAIGPVDVRGERIDVAGAQPSPGLLPTHYAPRAELIVCAGERAAALAALLDVARQAASADRRVGLLLADEDVWEVGDAPAQVATLGPRDDLTQIARNLFAAMRALDEQSLDVIVTRDFGERGVGLAIRDRLRRAASRVVE